MELNAIGRMRHAAVRAGEKKVPEMAVSAGTQPKTDKIVLTEQAVDVLSEQSRRLTELLRQEPGKASALWEIADPGGTAESDMLDELGEKMKVMLRCQKIAARIMRGDKVPPQDEQYLMQNDPDGYKMAIAMREPKKKPKEWDSVLEEEEKRAEGESGEGEASQASESVSGSGGGE